MPWIVEFHDDFEPEFLPSSSPYRMRCSRLPSCRPIMGGSSSARMRVRSAVRSILRFEAFHGEWRAAFAFDPERKAILLVGGEKSGGSQRRFDPAALRLNDAWRYVRPGPIEHGITKLRPLKHLPRCHDRLAVGVDRALPGEVYRRPS